MSHAAQTNLQCEADELPVVPLYGVLAFVVVFVAGSIVLGLSVGKKAFLDQRVAVHNNSVPAALTEGRAAAAALLQGTGAAESAGRVRIPIDEAMRTLVADPKLIQDAFVPPAPVVDTPTTH